MTMRLSPAGSSSAEAVASLSGGGYRDAESLFRTKGIAEIRNVEASTKQKIQDKKEELRQLVGNRYRDLIDSADSIVLMKSSCESISSNIASIHAYIRSLSFNTSSSSSVSVSRKEQKYEQHHHHQNDISAIYAISCRVKYLVDTPENIWGCLDESMFLEAACRYIRAKHVHSILMQQHHSTIFSNFPLLQHQWQIVESFKSQISQRTRDRLLDPGLPISAYADALAAVSLIDDLDPNLVLSLFLDTRKSWITQMLASFATAPAPSTPAPLFCQVVNIIQITVGQVGELFLQVLNDLPLFYKIVLGSPPASQLFGGIPNPDEEVRLWKLFREKLESVMLTLDKNSIATACLSWLRDCGRHVVSKINGNFLVDAIATGGDLALAEKSIRETMDSKQVLEESLEWLKSVFGSEIELPWSRIRELVLQDDSDLWDEIFEHAFVQRMKKIIDSGFENLAKGINVEESISAIGVAPGEQIDFQAYLNRPSTGGGVWFIEPKAKKSGLVPSKASLEENDFQSCLIAYFGSEVSRIRDAVDSHCQSILEDLLAFLESPKAALRLKDLVPFLQEKCYDSILIILTRLKTQLDNLYFAIGNSSKGGQSLPPAIVVERSLFIGRLLFALQSHSKHIPVILGSPRFWAEDTVAGVFDKLPSLLRPCRVMTDSLTLCSPGKQVHLGSRRQTSSATAALLGANENASPKLEDLRRVMRDLSIRAYNLWIYWLSDELSSIFASDLVNDDGLSATTPLRGWEEVVVKQEQSDDSQSEMRISLPSLPSLYVISFLFRACEEVHRIGGHVLDKLVLQNFASRLLEKVIDIYDSFISTRESHGSQVSEKGVLQILLDLKFAADVLSGGDSTISEELSRSSKLKVSFRWKQDQSQVKSVLRERFDGLINHLSQRLDPIDWLTYEPYLWENERQSYLRHAVLFGVFMQLNRMYTDTMDKLPNSESNIMRCSTVARFKYLPISAPALSSRGTSKTSIPASSENISTRSSWDAYTNGELSRKIDLDENPSFSVATPILKSFMQVGSRFGESTLKLGSMLTDGQVGIFKDRSAAAMSTFGDILPAQAAGLLSSFTATRYDS